MAREVVVRANYQRERQPEDEEAAVVVANGHRRFADAGRLLMLWGCGALSGVVVGSTAGRGRPADASSAVRAFVGLALLLLGVSLVALAPVARRFPRAARAGAAVADAVIGCFFPQLN